MATFVPGIRCSISGRAIPSADQAVAFPAFIANEADPLYVFSDAVVHIDAFRAHPLSAEVQSRYEEARARSAPTNRQCVICQNLIQDPEDYLGLGHLVSEPSHPLSGFNYAHFHKHCLSQWMALPDLIARLNSLEDSGAWKGHALKRLVNQLRASVA